MSQDHLNDTERQIIAWLDKTAVAAHHMALALGKHARWMEAHNEAQMATVCRSLIDGIRDGDHKKRQRTDEEIIRGMPDDWPALPEEQAP